MSQKVNPSHMGIEAGFSEASPNNPKALGGNPNLRNSKNRKLYTSIGTYNHNTQNRGAQGDLSL